MEANPAFSNEMNLVSVGTRGYCVLSRRLADDRSWNNGGSRFCYLFLENDKCSSGAGENILKIAGRFDLDIPEVDRLAQSPDELIDIQKKRFTVLDTADRAENRVTVMPEIPPA